MKQMIEEILTDLYALDKDLIQYDKQLRKAIEKIIQSKPDTKFDKNFKLRLKNELLAKINQIKSLDQKDALEKTELKNTQWSLRQLFGSRWALTVPVLATVLLVIFLGYGQYQKNGGLYLSKQNVQFSLIATKSDLAGVKADTSFKLEASRNLSEATIKKIVIFEPPIDFTVRKIRKSASIFSSAYATDDAMEKGLPYQYEIKAKKELEEDKIYKIYIKNEQIADRDYQWAFQIKASFSAQAIVPGNKETGVPLDSGIEIQFNRQLPENVAEYFSISPKAEGTFEKKYDKLYFHPKNLTEKTLYAVTIKKGLVSELDGEILSDDYVFSFETDRKDDDENENDFDLNNILTTVNPTMHPMISLSGEEGVEYEIMTYQLGGADDFIASYKSSKNFDLSWTDYAGDKNIDEYKPAENKKIFSAKASLIKGNSEGLYFEIPQNLEEGYYFYEIKIGDIRKAGWIVSSNVAHYYSLSRNSGLFWLYDFSAKKVLENAQISFISQEEKQIGQTDENGILKFEIPKELQNDKQDNPQFFRIITPNAKPIVIFAYNNYYSSDNAGENYWNYFSVDKNKYKPTDSINYWGILKGIKENIRGQKISVGLYEFCPYDFRSEEIPTPLISQDIVVSDQDTISGKISFAGLDTTNYCLAVQNAEKKIIFSTKYISIEKYDKPIYQITVESSKEAIFAGEEVVFKVRANFYDDTPVSNQELNYEIDSQKGKIKLNDFGEADFKYTPSYDEKYLYYPSVINAIFSPVLAEEGEIWGSASVQVFGANIGIDSEAKKISDGKYEINANLKNIILPTKAINQTNSLTSGEKIPNYSMKAKIIKITYVKKETGEYYDYITKSQKKTYEYESQEKKMDELSGKTDDTGNWKIGKDFEVSQDVSYRIDFEAIDQKGKKAFNSSYVYTGMGDKYVELEMNGEEIDRSSFGYSKKGFSFGENIKLSLQTSPEDKSLDGNALIYRYQNEIEDTFIIQGNNFEETFLENFSPSVNYRAVILTQYGFQESMPITASLKKEDKKLNIEIKSLKENYRPGEEARVQIILRDKEGNPVSAEVNVSAVDEALFQNNEDWNENVLTKLYQSLNPFLLSTDFTQYAVRMKGDGGGGGGDVRSSFLDVPYFTNIKTDSNGLATISFKLPDNLTGWRIIARAFDTTQMTSGQENIIISTSLPFFVDTTLNANYLTGDTPQMKIRFFGQDYDPSQPVEYIVTSDKLNLNQKGIASETFAHISLGVLPQGEYEIKIEAKQGEKGDALIRKISVSDGYAKKEESRVYNLTTDLKNIQGNENGYTKLMFVDQGKAKFFSILSDNANEMGMRLDQIVSAYVSKNILAKNYFKREFQEELSVDQFTENGDDGNGGLTLLKYGSEDLEISAKVADVVPDSINKDDLKDFFITSLYDSKADIHRISKALYGLASLNESVLNEINIVKKNKTDLTLEDKIYLGLALVKSGDIEGAKKYYEQEIKKLIQTENNQSWIENTESSTEAEKLTATLGILISNVDDRPMVENIWRYLEAHGPQRDLIVLEKTLIAKSELEKVKDSEAEFILKTNARTEKIKLSNGNEKEINLSKNELDSIQFEDVKGKAEVISLFQSPIDPKEIKNDPDLKLMRVYKLGENPRITFVEGDLVKVSLSPQFIDNSTEEGYQIIDALPSGLKIATRKFNLMLDFETEEDSLKNKCDMIWYPDNIDGNRVTFSFSKKFLQDNRCNNFSINYYARVVSKGTFKADSAMLQSMDNLNQYYILPTSQVEIK